MTGRLLVTGGRDYANRKFVNGVLDALHAAAGFAVLIHGAASGADTLAAEWAKSRGVPVDPHPARWGDIEGIPLSELKRNRRGQLYNPRAGFDRNKEMLEADPTHVVAFPGGGGTAHMCSLVRNARMAGRSIIFIDVRTLG